MAIKRNSAHFESNSHHRDLEPLIFLTFSPLKKRYYFHSHFVIEIGLLSTKAHIKSKHLLALLNLKIVLTNKLISSARLRAKSNKHQVNRPELRFNLKLVNPGHVAKTAKAYKVRPFRLSRQVMALYEG